MELKHTIELIHLCAKNAPEETRRKAIADYLRSHPEITREEATAFIAEAGYC